MSQLRKYRFLFFVVFVAVCAVFLQFLDKSAPETHAASPAANAKYAVQVFNARGAYLQEVIPGVTTDTVGNLNITFPSKSQFRPGLYYVRVYVVKNGVAYIYDSSFRWGVLALNFDKTVYQTGDTANIGFGVLDNMGHTICDAEAQLTVTGPDGTSVYTTGNNSIHKSPDCSDHSVTNNPDYSVVFTPRSVGTYHVMLVADTTSGVRRMEGGFTVETTPLYNVQRSGPTRIYPPATYRVEMHVAALQDFSGKLTETVPSSFIIAHQGIDGGEESIALTQNGEDAQIVWQASLKAGEEHTFWYTVKAPNISPEFYLLGPLTFSPQLAGVSWAESRRWQIAADANAPPNRPILNAPAPNATSALTSIVFNMTAIDPEGNNIQYQHTIYQNEACTQGVEGNNQNVSQTGWSLQNASASKEYTSGNTGVFTSSSTLTSSTVYYWGASAIDPEGSNNFGSSSLTIITPTWAVNASSLPTSTTGHSSVAYNGYLYVIGGCTGTCGPDTSTVNYAPLNSNGTVGAWTTTTALPKAIIYTSAAAYNGYLYTTGGSTANGACSSIGDTSTVNYAPLNSNGTVGTWATTTALPSKLCQHSALAYNGYLYTTGGSIGSACTSQTNATSTVNYAPLNSNGTVGTWATTTALPSRLCQHSALAYNGYLYTTGGLDNSSAGTSAVMYAPLNSNGTVGTWATTTALPDAVRRHTAVAYNGYLYVTGGCTGNCNNITSTVNYAPLNSTGTVGAWATTTALPGPNSFHSAVVSNGYLYVIGGGTSLPTNTSTVLYAQINMQGSTNSADSFISTTVLPSAHAGHTAVAYNGYLYVLGGATSTAGPATSSVFYAPVNSSGSIGSWTTNANALPGAIANHAAALYGNYIYTTGGSTTTATNAPATTSIFYAQVAANGTVGAWTTNATSLPSGILGHASIAYNGFLYTIGGQTSTASGVGGTTTVFFAPILSNASVGTVTTTTALPSALVGISAATANGFLYVVGGATTISGTATTSVFYAPINASGTLGTWANTAPLPQAMELTAAGIYNNFLYSIGGCTTPGSCTTVANSTTTIWYAQILPLNIGTGTISSWLTAPDKLLSSIYGTSVIIANGYLYVVGGVNVATPSGLVKYIGLYTSCTAFTPTAAAAAASSTPVVSAVTLNNGNALVLTPNATTTFNINFTVTDTAGCADIQTTTSTAFRTGVASTCATNNPTTSNLSCYVRVTNTTSSCISSTQINGTSTVDLYYFANSTGNGSSSFPAQHWEAYVSATNAANASSSATSTDVDVNVLTAISVTTSSINYGNVNANANTGATNQFATSTNAGNSSTTLQLYALQTLLNGSISIATSNQVYATSSFTYNVGSTSTALGDGAGNITTVSGFLLTSPTSTATSGYAQATYWGLAVPNGNASGSYTGTTVFQSLFAP